MALRAAFEIIRNEIEAFRDTGAAALSPVAEAPAPRPVEIRTAEIVEMPSKVIEPEPAKEVEAAANEPQLETETAIAEEMSREEADAHDEAVLDMVALEMAAPEPDEVHDLPFAVGESEHVHVTTPPIVEPLIPIVRVPEPEPPMQVARPEPMRPTAPTLQPMFQPSPPIALALAPAPEPSLGSSLIASGILRRPNIPANDPLAPIRRMSQAEKIAFFS